jgi:urease accessory protein
MAMSIEAMDLGQSQNSLFQLMSWLSPAFPVGAYAYSHGLEYAIECGAVTDRDQLITWLEGILRFGGAASDAQLLRAAWTATRESDVSTLTWAVDMGHAFRGSAELALESAAQGRAFITTVTKVWPQHVPSKLLGEANIAAEDLAYPIAIAVVCASAGITLSAALTAYLHGFVSNVTSAAVRLIPLGQTEGQQALAALQTTVGETVATTLRSEIRDLSNAALMVDWTSMQHETQYTRLFRS